MEIVLESQESLEFPFADYSQSFVESVRRRNVLKISDLKVELRLFNGDGAAKGVADVTLLLGGLGEVRLCGLRVIETKGEPWVAMPSRKGAKKYFPIVRLDGPVKQIITAAVLKQFALQRTAANP